MKTEPQRTESPRHPEIFWAVFVLVGAAAMMAVVEPARREAEEAELRVERARAELESIRQRVESLRRERMALERGDPRAWEAAGYAAGLGRPGGVSVVKAGPR